MAMHENGTLSGSTYTKPTKPTVFDGNSSLGLAVGLPIFLVAMVVVGIACILWFRQRKSVDIEVSNKLKRQEKSCDDNTSKSPYSGYTVTGGLQPTPQSPVYENFQKGKSTPHQFQKSAIQNEDTPSAHGVYYQCDPNDAIYSNDPTLYQQDPEESLYIMPDA